MYRATAKRDQRALEVILIIVTLALTCLVYKTDVYKVVTLNLFYLPVVLAGFFLGRYSAGVLAVLCVISTSLVCAIQVDDFATEATPLVVGLAVTIWAAVLCLTALMVGTLSDERSAQAVELHEAYVGVVEVLSRYLQGGNPQLNARADRVARLSQQVALEMKLSAKRIDDIRVAALLQDFGKIEVTTKVFSRAVDSLESKGNSQNFSFHGTDLVHSLGTVLRGAIPILLNQDEVRSASMPDAATAEVPIGAKILRVVQAYDKLTTGPERLTALEAIRELRADSSESYDQDAIDTIERVTADEPALAGV